MLAYDPVGLPVLPVAMVHACQDPASRSLWGTVGCRDDFGDSPRDRVIAHLEQAQHKEELLRHEAAAAALQRRRLPAGAWPLGDAAEPARGWEPTEVPAAGSQTGRRSRRAAKGKGGKVLSDEAASPVSPDDSASLGLGDSAVSGASSSSAAASGAASAADADWRGDDCDAAESHTAQVTSAWPLNATTVMLRNIPNRYTVEELLAEITAAGLQGTFDFFYLPIDFQTKRNRGYSFINFLTADHAARFVQAFHHQRLTKYSTGKILEVSPAVTQGFDANCARYVRKDAQRIKNAWFRPMIFGRNEDDDTVSTEAEERSSTGDSSA